MTGLGARCLLVAIYGIARDAAGGRVGRPRGAVLAVHDHVRAELQIVEHAEFEVVGERAGAAARTHRNRRPGRFDWEIEFRMPTLQDREEILRVSGSKLATSGPLPIKEVASRSDGWSAAKLTSIWTEAALIAAKADRRSICDLDFGEAFERVGLRPSPEGGANA